MLSNAEVNDLLAKEKIITANLRWRPKGGKYSENYTLEATVLLPEDNLILRLTGWKGKRNRSFVLLYSGDPIKKLTVHYKHRNPDGTMIYGPHKHAWDEENEDRNAYIPNDIEFGDVNSEFHGFLKQCHINLLGTYAPILM
jgi:hypothetical protein